MRHIKQEGRNRKNQAFTRITRTCERYSFLEKHSRVLVGVSGGVDSAVLLTLLHEYNIRFKQGWYIHACFVDTDIQKNLSDHMKSYFTSCNVPHTIVKTKVPLAQSEKHNVCYLCSRQRRKKLLEIAESMNIQQIALAHHKQDVAETLLLNMMFNGEISTLVPKQSIIQGRHFFIRPLYAFEKKDLISLADLYELSTVNSGCPYFEESKRNEVRTFLETCRTENPDIYKNIFRAVTHVKRTYLP